MKPQKFTFVLSLALIFSGFNVAMSQDCFPANNKIVNGSFEDGERVGNQWTGYYYRPTGWFVDGDARISMAEGYERCGDYYGLLTNNNDYRRNGNNPIVKIYQVVDLDEETTSVSLTIWAGKHSDCYTDIRLVFLNSSGAEISSATQTKEVTRTVTSNRGLAEYKIIATVIPSSAKQVRVEGRTRKIQNGTQPYLKLESALLTFTTLTHLPVDLATFSANSIENSVALNWQTTKESNTSLFEVQHSTNGTSWHAVGESRAAGNYEGISNYRFLHTAPVAGNNYYRLKMIDLDGSFELSKIVSAVHTVREPHAYFYPNPSLGRIQIEASGQARGVVVSDLTGRAVYQVSELGNNDEIDLSALRNGIYVIRWSDASDRRFSQRLVISR